MKLTELFNTLSPPNGGNLKLFNALSIPELGFAKLAINCQGFPTFLLSSQFKPISRIRDIALQFIEIKFDNECTIYNGSTAKSDNFITIQFKNLNPVLVNHFLNIASIFLKSLSGNPGSTEISSLFKNFIEIFRALAEPAKATIQGLWAELFVIENSKSPTVLIDYWHNLPSEKFDFNAGAEKIEVKSTIQDNRVHTFSAEQLFAFVDVQIIVASLFVRETPNGMNVHQLVEKIVSRSEDSEANEKLLRLVAKTLGNGYEQSFNIKFDYEWTRQSLRFYRQEDVAKIEAQNIPTRVHDVHYKSDLSLIAAVNIDSVLPHSILFKHC